jgi:hypothetical protein
MTFCRIATAAVLATLSLLLGFAGRATGDCCLQSSPPGRAPFHIQFKEPVKLAPSVRGRVSSEARSHYRAAMSVLVGGRAVIHSVKHGISTTAWSALRFRLTQAQRLRVREAARRQGRRPVLSVRVSGVLQGQTKRTAHARTFLMQLP